MISLPLYKRGLKSNWKTLVIFAAVLTLYFTVIISMFDPSLGSALDEFAKAMPNLMAMVGMNPSSATMNGFLSAYLYGFIMLVFPMIFSILCSNQLVARQVERGSMVSLLAAPVKRSKVVVTQMLVLVTGLVLLVAYATGLGIVNCGLSFPGELDVGSFLLLNLGALCLHLFIGGICFLSSCAFSDVKYSIGFGAGIPALMFIIQMMANAGKDLEAAKYATFFTLFHPDGITAGEPWAFCGIAVLFVGAVILFGTAITVFSKKDLSI